MTATGLARAIGLLAIGAWIIALAFFATGYVVSLRDDGFLALVWYGFGFPAALLALVATGAALIAAAIRKGTLPKWASAVGIALFAGAATVAAIGLTYSGTPFPVAIGLVGSLAGVAAGVRASKLA